MSTLGQGISGLLIDAIRGIFLCVIHRPRYALPTEDTECRPDMGKRVALARAARSAVFTPSRYSMSYFHVIIENKKNVIQM